MTNMLNVRYYDQYVTTNISHLSQATISEYRVVLPCVCTRATCVPCSARCTYMSVRHCIEFACIVCTRAMPDTRV